MCTDGAERIEAGEKMDREHGEGLYKRLISGQGKCN